MSKLFQFFAVPALIFLTALPSPAAKVTLVNDTPFSIIRFGLEAESFSMECATPHLYTGSHFTLGGNDGAVKSITLNSGYAIYTFSEGLEHFNSDDLKFSVHLDAFAEPPLPYLVPLDESGEEYPEDKADRPEPVVGKFQMLSAENSAELPALLAVRNKAEAKALGAQDLNEKMSYLDAGCTDIYMTTQLTFSDSYFDKDEPPSLLFYRLAADNDVNILFRELKALGYRPWFMQRYVGPETETVDMYSCWKDERTPDDAASLELMNLFFRSYLYDDGESGALDVLWIPAEVWDKASRGEDCTATGFMMYLSSSMNIVLQYLSDINGYIRILN